MNTYVYHVYNEYNSDLKSCMIYTFLQIVGLVLTNYFLKRSSESFLYNVEGSRVQIVIRCCICKRRWFKVSNCHSKWYICKRRGFKGSNSHSQCCICKRRGFKGSNSHSHCYICKRRGFKGSNSHSVLYM